MRRFIKELRRREVFRTAGLYVGIAWILIEAASVVLPAFDAPDWVLRGLIFVAVVGLPVAVALAWIYDVTDDGIEVQADPTDTVVAPFGGRRMDFVVIGLLSVALILSVYMNVTGNRSASVQEFEPLSVLIANFDNRTGDELFDGTLEQALQIGIESAPFITGYRRDAASRVASTLHGAGEVLNETTARLVAVREGIKLVMAGSIDEHDGSYTLYVRAVDPKGGEILAAVEVDADDKLGVLEAVGTLAGDLREELGDKSLDRRKLVTSETFTAANLEAAQAYAKAQSLQFNGKYDEAMTFYEEALAHDPGFGRAYSGLALSANALGKTDEAAVLWEKALATLDTMTERERLRTLGLYYSLVTRNYQKAIETYETLVEKYPADDTAHNGLAVQYFYALEFDNALREGGLLLDIYPGNVMGRSNYALFAMYASDFDMAVREAEKVRELDPTYFKSWLPVAMNALATGDIESANAAYEQMARAAARGVPTANLGLVDVAIFEGDFDAAKELLEDGIAADAAAGSQYFLSTKYMVLAEVQLALGDATAARDSLQAGLSISTGDSRAVPAAMLYLAMNEVEEARQIARSLADKLQPQSRAYGQMILGMIERYNGANVAAIDAMTAAVARADLWLLRQQLGITYLQAGYFAEALDEFNACFERRGEATALFLDDLPTYRYASTLPYWMARAQQELGMQSVAEQNYQAYIDRRPTGDPLADDARRRLQ